MNWDNKPINYNVSEDKETKAESVSLDFTLFCQMKICIWLLLSW